MQVHPTSVIPFSVPPRAFLSTFLESRAMFRPFTELLPSPLRRQHRARCERLLGILMRGVLHIPRLTESDIRTVIMHGKDPRKVMYRELAFMRVHDEWRSVLERWCAVWEYAVNDEERQFIRYATAMLARVYRLEYAIRLRGVLAATGV